LEGNLAALILSMENLMNKLFVMVLVLAAAFASAQQPQQHQRPQRREQGGGGGGGGGGPPPEALEACKGKKDGDTVQMTTPRGDKMSATCRLVAVPARPPGDNKGPPPQRQ
jgi:hypothetical protein